MKKMLFQFVLFVCIIHLNVECVSESLASCWSPPTKNSPDWQSTGRFVTLSYGSIPLKMECIPPKDLKWAKSSDILYVVNMGGHPAIHSPCTIDFVGLNFTERLILVLYNVSNDIYYLNTHLLNAPTKGKHRIIIDKSSSSNVYVFPMWSQSVQVEWQDLPFKEGDTKLRDWAEKEFNLPALVVSTGERIKQIPNNFEVILPGQRNQSIPDEEWRTCSLVKLNVAFNGHSDVSLSLAPKICTFVGPSVSTPRRQVRVLAIVDIFHSHSSADPSLSRVGLHVNLLEQSEEGPESIVIIAFMKQFYSFKIDLVIDTSRLRKHTFLVTNFPYNVTFLSAKPPLDFVKKPLPYDQFMSYIKSKFSLTNDSDGSNYDMEFVRIQNFGNSREYIVNIIVSKSMLYYTALTNDLQISCTPTSLSVSLSLDLVTQFINAPHKEDPIVFFSNPSCRLRLFNHRYRITVYAQKHLSSTNDCVVKDANTASKNIIIDSSGRRIILKASCPKSASSLQNMKFDLEKPEVALKQYGQERDFLARLQVVIGTESTCYFVMTQCSIYQDLPQKKVKEIPIFRNACLLSSLYPLAPWNLSNTILDIQFAITDLIKSDAETTLRIYVKCSYVKAADIEQLEQNKCMDQAFLCSHSGPISKHIYEVFTPAMKLIYPPPVSPSHTTIEEACVPLIGVTIITIFSFFVGIFLASGLYLVYSRTQPDTVPVQAETYSVMTVFSKGLRRMLLCCLSTEEDHPHRTPRANGVTLSHDGSHNVPKEPETKPMLSDMDLKHNGIVVRDSTC